MAEELEVDENDEYEESLVLVEVNGLFDPISTINKARFVKIWVRSTTEIDSAEPFMQVDDCFFQGHFEESVGTNIFLEKTYSGKDRKGNSLPINFQYKDHSGKVLKMDRAFLHPKKKPSADSAAADQASVEERKCGEGAKEMPTC
eukprot:m.35745 g.35745  ORF g.35745 m.35745 type:complete len:145 (+) comp32177_c0_seq1:17-451(+)